jgi:hypothetical protein
MNKRIVTFAAVRKRFIKRHMNLGEKAASRAVGARAGGRLIFVTRFGLQLDFGVPARPSTDGSGAHLRSALHQR